MKELTQGYRPNQRQIWYMKAGQLNARVHDLDLKSDRDS